jgi:hypothetical protein
MMAAVRAMKASWISWRIARRMRRRRNQCSRRSPVRLSTGASRHLVQVAATGADRAGRSADGFRLLGTRSVKSARSGPEQLVELPDHGVVLGGEEYGHKGLGAEGKHLVAAVRIGATVHEQAGHLRLLGNDRPDQAGPPEPGRDVDLVSVLATNERQRSDARRLVYALLGEESDYWPTLALQRLGKAVKDDLAFLGSQGWAIRCFAASLWAEHGKPSHLGNRLAADRDVRVRRELTRALSRQPETLHVALRERLAVIPAYSVRLALAASSDIAAATLSADI